MTSSLKECNRIGIAKLNDLIIYQCRKANRYPSCKTGTIARLTGGRRYDILDGRYLDIIVIEQQIGQQPRTGFLFGWSRRVGHRKVVTDGVINARLVPVVIGNASAGTNARGGLTGYHGATRVIS